MYRTSAEGQTQSQYSFHCRRSHKWRLLKCDCKNLINILFLGFAVKRESAVRSAYCWCSSRPPWRLPIRRPRTRPTDEAHGRLQIGPRPGSARHQCIAVDRRPTASWYWGLTVERRLRATASVQPTRQRSRRPSLPTCSCQNTWLVFISDIFWGDGFPPQKNLPPPKKAAKLCALNHFFRPRQWITNISRKHVNGQ